MVPLQAGVARVALDPPLGVPLMGYALREGTAAGRRDPLYARALYLAGDGGALLWIALDLCLLAPVQAQGVRTRVARKTGLAEAQIAVACIHTHSGPETGYGAALSDQPTPPFVAPFLDAACEAGERAFATAAPARMGWGDGEAEIGRNRRREDGPLDARVEILRVDTQDGAPLAVLYVHGCHPTVLGHDSLVYSADWPGPAAQRIEAALPGCTALFVLGAHADVDPRTRGLMDLALDAQSVGAPYEAVETLGHEIGDTVARAAAGIRTAGDARIRASHDFAPLAVHGPGEASARREWLASRRGEALAALDVPADTPLRTHELYALSSERLTDLPAETRRTRLAVVRGYLRDRTAEVFARGTTPEVEVQVLELGDARLLALPLEATVDVGLAWRARMRARGSGRAAVLSIANGWLRYLPHDRNFDEAGAERHYEVLQSTFAPHAATALLDRGEALLSD